MTTQAPGNDATAYFIDAWQRATAHDSLKRWMAGDRTVNNGLRSHE